MFDQDLRNQELRYTVRCRWHSQVMGFRAMNPHFQRYVAYLLIDVCFAAGLHGLIGIKVR